MTIGRRFRTSGARVARVGDRIMMERYKKELRALGIDTDSDDDDGLMQL